MLIAEQLPCQMIKRRGERTQECASSGFKTLVWKLLYINTVLAYLELYIPFSVCTVLCSCPYILYDGPDNAREGVETPPQNGIYISFFFCHISLLHAALQWLVLRSCKRMNIHTVQYSTCMYVVNVRDRTESGHHTWIYVLYYSMCVCTGVCML